MAALSFTAANISADPIQGSIIRNKQAGAAVSVGQAVYIDSDGKVQPADANVSLTTSMGHGVVVNSASLYGETSIASGAYCSICVFGPVYGFTGLAEGTQAWVGATAGEIVDTAPTGGAYQRVMGYALESDVFFVDPGQSTPGSV